MFEPINLGPCTLQFGDLNINYTEGGVTLHVEPELHDITVDQFGTGPVDQRITGWNIRVIAPLAQTDYDSIKGAATFLEEVPAGDKLTDRQLGASMRDFAKQLRLHPTKYTDDSHDVILYLATPVTAMELGYNYSDQRVYSAEFLALPKDQAQPGDSGNYFEMGGVSGAVSLYTATFSVTGDGTALSGAEVAITGISTTKLTDVSGDAYFNLPDGAYTYQVSKAGFDTETGSFTIASADQTVSVALTTPM